MAKHLNQYNIGPQKNNMSTAIEYSSQQGPKFNQRLLKGKLLEKQENLNLFIDNVLYGVDLTILSDKVYFLEKKILG